MLAGALITVVALSGPFTTLEHARRPPRIAPFWDGLPSARERAPAEGIVALRLPLERRVRITGGRFVMGSTAQEMQDALQLCAKEPLGTVCQQNSDHPGSIVAWIRSEGHAHEVTLSDFELDVSEVTVERYRRCVEVGACSPPAFGSGDARYDQPSFPVTHVTWADATSFCVWDGGRLPTEAEWELAARGHDNNTFPWGKLYNPHLSNHGSVASERTDAGDGFAGLAPVGSFLDGATPTGLLDMAGNAAEWVFDLYDRDEQQFGYPRAAQTNPTGAVANHYGHAVRGGSYRSGAHDLRAAARRASSSFERDIGFRCARGIQVAPAVRAP